MSPSFRTTEAHIDTDAFSRLMEVARETDVYNTRREARQDSFEEIINLLIDDFETEDNY